LKTSRVVADTMNADQMTIPSLKNKVENLLKKIQREILPTFSTLIHIQDQDCDSFDLDLSNLRRLIVDECFDSGLPSEREAKTWQEHNMSLVSKAHINTSNIAIEAMQTVYSSKAAIVIIVWY
jgi:hypothetical protein